MAFGHKTKGLKSIKGSLRGFRVQDFPGGAQKRQNPSAWFNGADQADINVVFAIISAAAGTPAGVALRAVKA